MPTPAGYACWSPRRSRTSPGTRSGPRAPGKALRPRKPPRRPQERPEGPTDTPEPSLTRSEALRSLGRLEEPCLFLLDEFAALGRLEAVERAMGLMAGYGLQLNRVDDQGRLLEKLAQTAAETRAAAFAAQKATD